MRRESNYQAELVRKLKILFPGCFVLKNDPTQNQGIPDIQILFRNRWAMLEVKRSANEPERPNQSYFVDELNKMSFAAFIYPENEDEVLNDLAATFRAA